jgi:Zn-dependent oligopeptidase
MFATKILDFKDNKLNDLEKTLLNTELDLSSITKESVNEYLERIKTQYAATYDKIAKSKTISFATTIQPLIDLNILTDNTEALCTFPKYVHTDKEVRDACTEASIGLETLGIKCIHRNDVFKKIQQYVNEKYQIEKLMLSYEENRFVQDLMVEYKRNGMLIPDQKQKDQISDMQKELADLSEGFSQNLSEDSTTKSIKHLRC